MVGREDSERERSQCDDPAGDWKPEPGERTVCSSCLLSGVGLVSVLSAGLPGGPRPTH